MVLALFVIFFVLIILGIPIGVSIGLAVFSVILCSGQVSCVIASQALIRQISSFSLVAIPFFMLAGEIMEKSGITQLQYKSLLILRMRLWDGSQEGWRMWRFLRAY